jgi:type IV pilus biogenesis protein CpaD/CtpE
MKTATALALTALVLAGCTGSGDTIKRPEIAVARPASHDPVAGADGSTTFDRPVDRGVMAAGTSPINPDKQVAFCQDQVAFMFKAEPQYVTTRERIVAADGSTTIDVAVDKGNEGVKAYKCRLDAGNRFIDVIASTSDGTL